MKYRELQKQSPYRDQSSKSSSQNLFEESTILCSQGNYGNLYCMQCKNNAVVCDLNTCSCHQIHQKCEYFQNIKNLHQNLNSKILKTFKPDGILEATNHITDQVQKLENQIEQEFTYFGLSDAELEISKIIKATSEGKTVRGQDLNKFKQKRQKQRCQQYKFEDSLIKFKKIINTSKTNVLKLFHQLEERVVKQHIKFFDKKFLSEILKSEILKSNKELQTLNSLINPNLRIQNTQKIFSHFGRPDMNLKDLFNACEQKSSLLFLIQNKLGKKFGVYSECLLEKNRITKNPNKQSCLFSIDCNISQTSQKQKILFHSAYIQNYFGGKLTFEMFDDTKKQSLSYLTFNKAGCYYNVTGFNQYNINGISQNPVDWGRCSQIKNVQVFQVYFDKNQRVCLNKNQKVQLDNAQLVSEIKKNKIQQQLKKVNIIENKRQNVDLKSNLILRKKDSKNQNQDQDQISDKSSQNKHSQKQNSEQKSLDSEDKKINYSQSDTKVKLQEKNKIIQLIQGNNKSIANTQIIRTETKALSSNLSLPIFTNTNKNSSPITTQTENTIQTPYNINQSKILNPSPKFNNTQKQKFQQLKNFLIKPQPQPFVNMFSGAKTITQQLEKPKNLQTEPQPEPSVSMFNAAKVQNQINNEPKRKATFNNFFG